MPRMWLSPREWAGGEGRVLSSKSVCHRFLGSNPFVRLQNGMRNASEPRECCFSKDFSIQYGVTLKEKQRSAVTKGLEQRWIGRCQFRVGTRPRDFGCSMQRHNIHRVECLGDGQWILLESDKQFNSGDVDSSCTQFFRPLHLLLSGRCDVWR